MHRKLIFSVALLSIVVSLATTTSTWADQAYYTCRYHPPSCCGVQITVMDEKVCEGGRGGITCTQYLQQYTEDRSRICGFVQQTKQGEICPKIRPFCEDFRFEQCWNLAETRNRQRQKCGRWDKKKNWCSEVRNIINECVEERRGGECVRLEEAFQLNCADLEASCRHATNQNDKAESTIAVSKAQCPDYGDCRSEWDSCRSRAASKYHSCVEGSFLYLLKGRVPDKCLRQEEKASDRCAKKANKCIKGKPGFW